MNASTTNSAEARLTEHTAKFISTTRYEDIPATVLRAVKVALLDKLGAGLAGSRSKAAGIIRRYIGELGVSAGSSTVFGTRTSIDARQNSMLNFP